MDGSLKAVEDSDSSPRERVKRRCQLHALTQPLLESDAEEILLDENKCKIISCYNSLTKSRHLNPPILQRNSHAPVTKGVLCSQKKTGA
ncbi:hypothetical protein QJS04_geneDACA013969 [Acorus gramineus]|uniref:Uncharacterized protein n=1 Tax=Acorus gramineus TaxID=55184 RepID=A0AAV9AV87_ACOGR|nr:hypothetical protein QJS04_geneDACA013969 [Acorus gramineus]